MPYQSDVGAPDVDVVAGAPTLELTIDPVSATVRCAGTLDGRTRRHMVEAVEALVARGRSTVTVDVQALDVSDDESARTLAHVQRLVRKAGRNIRWHGLRADHFGSVLRVRYRARRRAVVLGAAPALVGRQI